MSVGLNPLFKKSGFGNELQLSAPSTRNRSHSRSQSRCARRAAVLEFLTADSLPNVQLISNQDPYVVATAWPSKYTSSQTECHAGGGIAPRWKGLKNNTLYVVVEDDDSSILIQVWNANLLLEDELIDTVEIPVVRESNGLLDAEQVSVWAMGGCIQLTIIKKRK
jgi:hypothetical protein